MAASLIKFFQVIEIFGIFFFIPAEFGDYLDDFLYALNNIADLLALP